MEIWKWTTYLYRRRKAKKTAIEVETSPLEGGIKGGVNQAGSKPKKRKPPTLESYLAKLMQIAPNVAHILKTNYPSRDDDNILVLAVWDKQTQNTIKTYKQLKGLLLSEQIAQPDTITRARRKLQEKYPELRGDLYAKRHRAEAEIKKQMKFDFMEDM